MLDNGFIGHFPVGGTVMLALQCRSQDLQVANPTGTPTYSVLNPDGTAIKSGTAASTSGSLTGFRFDSLELTEDRNWQPGVTYTVVFEYVQGGENRACISTFQVV